MAHKPNVALDIEPRKNGVPPNIWFTVPLTSGAIGKLAAAPGGTAGWRAAYRLFPQPDGRFIVAELRVIPEESPLFSHENDLRPAECNSGASGIAIYGNSSPPFLRRPKIPFCNFYPKTPVQLIYDQMLLA